VKFSFADLNGSVPNLTELSSTSFIYNDYRNEETKALNKINRDKLSLDAHNCIYYNHRLISSFL
jgi:hypothetical protein